MIYKIKPETIQHEVTYYKHISANLLTYLIPTLEPKRDDKSIDKSQVFSISDTDLS